LSSYEFLKKNNGSIQFSLPNKLTPSSTPQPSGSIITLTLPTTAPPKWFVSEIMLNTDERVYVVDDDQSIHEVWEGRFASCGDQARAIERVHYSDIHEFKKHIQDPTHDHKALILIDYEFLRQGMSGLQLIEEMSLQNRAILVTSRYDEERIQEKARTLGLRILPKNLVVYVRINFKRENTKSPNFVLLDDDPLIHLIWRSESKETNALYFTKESELLSQIESLSKATPIYIDQNLGEASSRPGSKILEELHANGFKRLYLCTGDSHLTSTDVYTVCGKGYPGK